MAIWTLMKWLLIKSREHKGELFSVLRAVADMEAFFVWVKESGSIFLPSAAVELSCALQETAKMAQMNSLPVTSISAGCLRALRLFIVFWVLSASWCLGKRVGLATHKGGAGESSTAVELYPGQQFLVQHSPFQVAPQRAMGQPAQFCTELSSYIELLSPWNCSKLEPWPCLCRFWMKEHCSRIRSSGSQGVANLGPIWALRCLQEADPRGRGKTSDVEEKTM